jgi:pyruvate,water dikinase
LNLTDPDADFFRAGSCTTYHDVIRFAHEMSVRELLELPGLTARDRRRFIKRLTLDIPMDLDILDLGGGIASISDDAFVGRDGVCSMPLAALLQGLCAPGAWRTEPVDMDMESFLTSATRASSFTALDAAPVRPNLAVISEDYLNLNLRLGYHFNLIDSRLADDPTNNYIYFRFTGGVTDITRRSRRARVIAAILQEYEFGVETKGDLVVGRIRNIESEPMRERLEMIGRLIGFTRQLDVLMRDEETVRERTRAFVGHELVYFDGLLMSENEEEM